MKEVVCEHGETFCIEILHTFLFLARGHTCWIQTQHINMQMCVLTNCLTATEWLRYIRLQLHVVRHGWAYTCGSKNTLSKETSVPQYFNY